MTASYAESAATRAEVLVPRQRSIAPAVRPQSRRPHARFASALAFALDSASLAVAGVLAALLAPVGAMTGLVGGGLGLAVALVWISTIFSYGGYAVSTVASASAGAMRVFKAAIVTIAVIAASCYLAGVPLPRALFVLTMGGALVLSVASRAVAARAIGRARAKGSLVRRVLLVGDQSHVDEFAEVLERRPSLGYFVIGALTSDGTTDHTAHGVRVLGDADSAVDIALSADADLLLFTGGGVTSSADLRTVAWELQRSRTRVAMAPAVTDIAPERMAFRQIDGVPLLRIGKPRADASSRRAKRAFDMLGAALLLTLTAPLFAFVAFQIWRTDRGPILFSHERIGRDGVPFGCLKFRTMVVDADKRLAELLAQRGVDGAIFAKLKDDPRITKPGRWLRRLSLDELPQLLNVLRGDMSLVGPRPQVASEVAEYCDVMARRLHVKPGMTGLWQVSGRSDLSVEDSIRLDAYYVENWSMARDIGILARTPIAVLTARGAY